MANNLNCSEIVKFAIQIEKNGRDFYDLASKNVKAEKVRQVFEYISNDEQLHIAVFEGLQSRLYRDSGLEESFTAEYSQYLKALIEINSFTQSKQGSELARTIRNDKHALELALSLEKDTILFYHEMKVVLDSGLNDDLDKLIVSEQDHCKKLSDAYKGFNKFGINRD